MSFGRDFREGLLGTDILRDAKHGERVFVADTMALAPRYKFLYHTYFGLNHAAVPYLRSIFTAQHQSHIGILAKSVQLPNFDVQTETLNQYNRSRIVQTGIKYQPVTITLHDDGNDTIRSLWRQYYMYYYGDSRNGMNDAKGNRNIYSQSQPNYNWGLSGESIGGTPGVKPAFFTDITVYGLNKKSNVGYRLVNPMIKTWQHDTYDYSDSSKTMEHTVTVEYEYVEYLDTTANTGIPGFAEPDSYDTAPSPLGQTGSTSSILGPGGAFDSAGRVLDSLASGDIFGAGLNAVRTWQGAKKITKAGTKEEVISAVKSAIPFIGGRR